MQYIVEYIVGIKDVSLDLMRSYMEHSEQMQLVS